MQVPQDNPNYQGVQRLFELALKGVKPSVYSLLSFKRPSTGKSEYYNGLGSAPSMEEWRDEIPSSGIGAAEYTIYNKNWVSSIDIDQDAIDDNALGQYTQAIASLAEKASYYDIHQLRKLLVAGEQTTYGPCVTGKAFFATDHELGNSGAQSNIVTGTGTTLAQINADIGTCLGRFASFLDDQGDYMDAGPLETVAIIPPIGAVIATFDALINGAQEQGTPSFRRVVKDYVIEPSLTDTNDWFLGVVSQVAKPFVFQERKAVHTTMTYDPDRKPEYKYSAHARAGFAYGSPFTLLKVKNT